MSVSQEESPGFSRGEDVNKMDERSLTRKVIVTALLVLLAIVALMPSNIAKTSAAKERVAIIQSLGSSVAGQIDKKASNAAKWLYDRVWRAYPSDAMHTSWGRDRADVVYWVGFLAVERIMAVLYVGLLAAPLVVGAAIDGLVARASEKADMEYINKVRYDLGFHLAHVTLLLPLLLLVFPLPVPTWAFFVWWLLLAVGVRVISHYLHHRI